MTPKIMITALSILAIFILGPAVGNGGEVDALHKGEELFRKHCAACHGEEAIGQDPSQPAGGWDMQELQLAPALNGSGHAWHHSPALLFDYIQKGSIDGTSPMPSFGNVLGDDQIAAIISYFQSLWPEGTRRLYRERFPATNE